MPDSFLAETNYINKIQIVYFITYVHRITDLKYRNETAYFGSKFTKLHLCKLALQPLILNKDTLKRRHLSVVSSIDKILKYTQKQLPYKQNLQQPKWINV